MDRVFYLSIVHLHYAVNYGDNKPRSLKEEGNVHMSEKMANWDVEQTYRQLPDKFYREVEPETASDPELILFNTNLADALGLGEYDRGIDWLSGNDSLHYHQTIAQSYAGHQFGHFTMLGDGRAILLGEFIAKNNNRYDWQLKGAGKTPYSRGGDGRASLGPMLREYIISEAMHSLNIPTTRSLAVVITGNPVIRETELQGAVLSRIAQSHLRVGTFEFAAAYGKAEDVKLLADYAINRHDPYLSYEENPYIAFAKNVMKRQASLIAKWQLVGFVHGVMNTDNMTISGETIDYGPCAFIDVYDPQALFSSIDTQGRYRYENQPAIAQWNIARLTETLLPLFSSVESEAIDIATGIVNEFPNYYMAYWLDGMRHKLGLKSSKDNDEILCRELLAIMKKYRADYTQTFFKLTIGEWTGGVLFHSAEFKQWAEKWQNRYEQENRTWNEVQQMMKKYNPIVIPRNRWVEEAIKQAVTTGQLDQVKKLLQILNDPYTYSSERIVWGNKHIPLENFITYCGT